MSESRSGLGRDRPPAPERPRLDLPELAWRVARSLSRADRRSLALRLLETEADEIVFRCDGNRWTAFPWDHMISGPLFVHGSFQGPEVRAVLDWMRRHGRLDSPRDVIIDVGANIGTSTIPFAQQTKCRVLAIEPVPDNFAVLCRNVTDNGLAPRVTCVQAAITTMPSRRVRMILPAGNSGGGEVRRPDTEATFAGGFSVRGTVDVPTMRLADLLDAQGVAPERVALVWSDTQGCEAEVVESGRPLWAAGVPLFVELDPLSKGGGVGSLEALLTAATAHFVGFIPAEALVRDAEAGAEPEHRAISELAALGRTLRATAADVLLLPSGFDVRPAPGGASSP